MRQLWRRTPTHSLKPRSTQAAPDMPANQAFGGDASLSVCDVLDALAIGQLLQACSATSVRLETSSIAVLSLCWEPKYAFLSSGHRHRK